MSTANGSGKTRPNHANAEPAAPRQKPYAKPKLTMYGDIRAITQAVGNMGAKDNGNPPVHKSQL